MDWRTEVEEEVSEDKKEVVIPPVEEEKDSQKDEDTEFSGVSTMKEYNKLSDKEKKRYGI